MWFVTNYRTRVLFYHMLRSTLSYGMGLDWSLTTVPYVSRRTDSSWNPNRAAKFEKSFANAARKQWASKCEKSIANAARKRMNRGRFFAGATAPKLWGVANRLSDNASCMDFLRFEPSLTLVGSGSRRRQPFGAHLVWDANYCFMRVVRDIWMRIYQRV